MKVSKAIEIVNKIKPNAFPTAAKIRWLNHLEGRIAADVFLLAPAEIEALTLTEDSEDWELLVKAPHDDVYTSWLRAQIDLENGEYNKYQNTMQEFNACMDSFTAWFANLYEPAQGYLIPGPRTGGM